jgi:hypothetical protein
VLATVLAVTACASSDPGSSSDATGSSGGTSGRAGGWDASAHVGGTGGRLDGDGGPAGSSAASGSAGGFVDANTSHSDAEVRKDAHVGSEARSSVDGGTRDANADTSASGGTGGANGNGGTSGDGSANGDGSTSSSGGVTSDGGATGDGGAAGNGGVTGKGGATGVTVYDVWTSPAGVSVRCLPFAPYETNDDGSVVVGARLTGAPNPVIWKDGVAWTLVCPTEVGIGGSFASATTPDGRVTVGTCTAGSVLPSRAFRYTETDGFRFLGDASRYMTLESFASDLSADGTVVVGHFYVPGTDKTASVWTQSAGFRTDVPLPSGRVVSDDGSIVLGSIQESNAYPRQYRWTEAGGLEDLNWPLMGYIADLSGDEQVMVGTVSDVRYTYGIRRTSQALEVLPCPGRTCSVSKTNADGSVVVGDRVWERHRDRDLPTFFATYGFRLAQSTQLTSVSADARVFIGIVAGAYGFVLTLPESPTKDSPDGGSGHAPPDAPLVTVDCTHLLITDNFVYPRESGNSDAGP